MRNICIEIPKEDLLEADKRLDKVGHFRMSLYGTRDAAMNWQEEVAKEMRKIGFERGRYNPCLYYHRQRTSEHSFTGMISPPLEPETEFNGSRRLSRTGSRSRPSAWVPEPSTVGGRRYRAPLPGPPLRPPRANPFKKVRKVDFSTASFAVRRKDGKSRQIRGMPISSCKSLIWPKRMGSSPRGTTSHVERRARMRRSSALRRRLGTGRLLRELTI